MYAKFYGLATLPFQLTPDARFFFESTVHRQAMAYMVYGLHHAEGFIVITGEAQVSSDDPSADQLPAYVEKYRDFIANRYETPENFASIYSVALRIFPITIRGH